MLAFPKLELAETGGIVSRICDVPDLLLLNDVQGSSNSNKQISSPVDLGACASSKMYLLGRGILTMIELQYKTNGTRHKTNGTRQLVMEDVHKEWDERNLPIDQVGVNHILFPIVVMNREGQEQHTVAELSMSVNLPHDLRGTHMSRFIEVLNEYQGDVAIDKLPLILGRIKERLESDSARIEINFPYFVERAAPVSGASAIINYECAYLGDVSSERNEFMQRVRVPICALCPCSKKISDYGAHNQRGYLTIEVWNTLSDDGMPIPIWVEELIEIAEGSGSAPVYPLLKRPDERHVTMQAYDNPVFVEDIVRTATEQLKDDHRIARFKVHAENHESIHGHNVYAVLEWSRP